MDKKEAEELFEKYISGTCSADEKLLFESLYVRIAGAEKHDDVNVYNLKEVRDKIYARLPRPAKKRKLWRRISVAAAIAAITFGIWFYNARQTDGRPEFISGSQDIRPGKNRATLTLDNGKTLTLSDAKTGVIITTSKLTYNDGSVINDSTPEIRYSGESRDRSPAMKTLTIATPPGGTYQITLPDGTKAWLNAASSLTYTAPLKEHGGRRFVMLSGEAYFEVFKNKKQPFVVASKKMELTVLGTHFNISAYGDENSTKATLLEGSVRVVSSTSPGSPTLNSRHPGEGRDLKSVAILKPAEQATLSGSNRFTVTKTDPNEAIAWKNGDFIFTKQSLADIMKHIARWYDVKVSYDQSIDVAQTFSIMVSRNKNISQILSSLEKTGKVKFKINGKQVQVSK